MVLQTLYRKGGSNTAVYDWLDVTSGVGYKTYYGAGTNLVAGIDYLLTASANVDAGIIKTDSANLGTPAAKMLDLDFDIQFKVPTQIQGTAYINATFGGITGDVFDTYFAIARVYHVDGAAAETQIGTATTGNRSGATGTNKARELINLELTKTFFAVGDKLRLTMEIWANDATPGTAQVALYHDPASITTVTDFDGNTRSTDLTIAVPLKVDL